VTFRWGFGSLEVGRSTREGIWNQNWTQVVLAMRNSWKQVGGKYWRAFNSRIYIARMLQHSDSVDCRDQFYRSKGEMVKAANTKLVLGLLKETDSKRVCSIVYLWFYKKRVVKAMILEVLKVVLCSLV